MPRMDQRPNNIGSITSKLLNGDPFTPQSDDIIAQEGRLAVGEPCPEGWRVLTGNQFDSMVVRTVMRYEIEDEFFVEKEKVLEYRVEELIALIQEHEVMPCKSLQQRMETGARAARKAVDDV